MIGKNLVLTNGQNGEQPWIEMPYTDFLDLAVAVMQAGCGNGPITDEGVSIIYAPNNGAHNRMAYDIYARLLDRRTIIEPIMRNSHSSPDALPLCEEAPFEVMAAVDRGLTPVAAWRKYKRFTFQDMADFAERSITTMRRYENAPYLKPEVLALFARIFDCTTDQLLRSDDCEPPAPRSAKAKRRPAGHARLLPLQLPHPVFYPAEVRQALAAGVHPVRAWREHRGLSLQQVAKRYGSSVANIKLLERPGNMRQATAAKLARIFECAPDQLRLGAGLPPAEQEVAPRQRRRQ